MPGYYDVKLNLYSGNNGVTAATSTVLIRIGD